MWPYNGPGPQNLIDVDIQTRLHKNWIAISNIRRKIKTNAWQTQKMFQSIVVYI